MTNAVEAFLERWLRSLLWVPLGLLLFLLPTSSILLVLQALNRGDRQGHFLPLLPRLLRRLTEILRGVALGAATLTGELFLSVALAVLLRRFFAFRVSFWLFVPLTLYLLDLAVLFGIGKVPLRYNLRNLTLRWLTTAMTALAFTLVIGLLTTLLAFVNGMDRLTENSGQPGNVIVLSNGAMDEAYSVLVDAEMSDVEFQESVLKESDLDGRPRSKGELDRRLCSKEVYIAVNQPIAPDEGKAPALQARGTVKSITPDKEEFLLIDDRGEALRLRMADNGKVFSNGAPAPFDQLRLGYKAWVAYDQQAEERYATEVRAANRRCWVHVRGMDDGGFSAKVHGLSLLEGTWFSEAGVQDMPAGAPSFGKAPEQAVQAVLGEGIARELARDYGKDRLAVGDVFELGPRHWVVVGIMQSAGSTFGSEVWAKRSIVGPMFGKFPNYSSLLLRTKDAAAAKALAAYLGKDFKKAAVNAQTEAEYYSKMSETNKQFSRAIYFITAIMAIGGIFGVMNTMFAAVSQRIKDIGVLRTVGYQRWQILVSFVLESMVIGLLGSILGAALAYLLFDGLTATSIVSNGQGAGKPVVIQLTVSLGTLTSGALLALIIGRVGGLIPALSAMRLKILDSLR